MKKLLLFITIFTFIFFETNAQVNYNGNGNGGFGEPVGGSNMTINDDGNTVTITFNKGIGDFNDDMVMYIDSQAGGFTSTANFANPDAGDRLRRAITGAGIFDGGTRSVVNFPAGFQPDFAIGVNTGFGGLWELIENGEFPFITGVGNITNPTDASFVMSFNKTDIGIGATDNVAFNFVITYMNAFGDNGVFRSDEGYGAGLPIGNPGTDDVTFTSFEVYDSTLSTLDNNFNTINTNIKDNHLIIEGLNGNASIELFNLLGQNVLQVKNVTISNSASFNLGNMSKGIYLARLAFNGQIKTFKLINRSDLNFF